MPRVIGITIGILVILAGLAVLAAGVFPPAVHPVAVEHTLPNAQFKTQ